jgi:hypothetical protein
MPELVLLTGACSEYQGHTTSRTLILKFKGEEIRDLSSAPIPTTGKHIVAEEEINQSPEVTLW